MNHKIVDEEIVEEEEKEEQGCWPPSPEIWQTWSLSQPSMCHYITLCCISSTRYSRHPKSNLRPINSILLVVVVVTVVVQMTFAKKENGSRKIL
jgi:hypothetical protein